MAQASLPGPRSRVRTPLPDSAQLPSRVSDELRRLEGRIRSLSVLSGLAIALLTMVAIAATTFALDYWFDLSTTSRWVALLVLIASGGGLGLYGLRRLFVHVPLPELAAAVEEKHPEFGERLLSLVEFSRTDIEEKDKGSSMMRTLLERETLKLVTPTDFTDVVDHSRAWWRSLAAGIALALLLIPFAVWKDSYQLLWARLLTPWNNFERPSNLFFEIPNGDRVAPRGEDVKILAHANWRNQLPEPIKEVRLAWTFDQGRPEQRRMAWDEAANAYSTTLSEVQQGFRYSVSAPGAKTRDYQIRVEDRPALTALQIDVQPPSYTGLPAEQFTASVLEIQAFEHSRVSMQLSMNKPVQHLNLVWLDLESVQRADVGRATRVADDAPEGVVLDAAPAPFVVPKHLAGKFPGWIIRSVEPCVMSVDQRLATVEFTVNRAGRFVLHAIDEFGLDNVKEPIRSIDLKVDQPPTVDFADVNEQGTAKPDEIIEVPVYSTDDVGLAALELHVKTFPEGKALKVVTIDADQLGVQELAHAFPLNLAEFGLLNEDVISVRARAADERAIPGPNEAWTHERLIRIKQDSIPYGFEAIAAEREQWKEALELLRNEVIANRSEIQDMQKSVEQSQKENKAFDRDSQVPRLAEVQRKISDQAQQLAATFNDHPLFEKLAPSLQEVAVDDATPAAEKTEQVPGTPDLAAKNEALKQATTELNEAEARLKALQEQFDKQAALEKDLFELQRLAGRTEQLAKDTEKYEQQRDMAPTAEAEKSPDAMQPLTPEQQQKQKDELLDRHNSLSQDLNQLLQKRPELLTAAQEALLQQLQQLFDRAAELADREDRLGESLNQEALKAAQQLSPQQQKQQQLQSKAEDLAADQELQQDQKVAKPVDLQEFAKALTEMESGDTQQAAAAQLQAATDLEKLAEALERNANLPADPQAAARELSQREHQLKDQLQQVTQKEHEARQARQQAEQQKQSLTPEQQKIEQQLAQQRRDLALEQAALQTAAAQLDVPRHAKDQQREAIRNGQDAVQQLLKEEPQQKPDTAQRATEAADRAANHLEQLANQIGTPEERQQRVIHEVRGIHEEQKSLAHQAAELRRQQAEGQPLDQLAEMLKQQAQKEMELAQRLAELEPRSQDAAQQAMAESQQQQALEKMAAAATDLQQQNLANSDATQAQAEQALADLRKHLEDQPTAAESLAQAAAKQAEVTQATEKAHQAGDQRQAQLHQQKDQQHQLAQSLEPVETPVAPELREAAKQAAYEARDALDRAAIDPQQHPAAEQALARSQRAIDALAEALKPQGQSPAEAAQALAQEQKSAAEQAQQATAQSKAPTPQAATQAADELRQRQQELSELRGPESTQPEKQAAKKALSEAAKAQQQVEQLARQQPAPAEGATEPPVPTPELQQAMQQAAKQQQTAADALVQLAAKMEPANAAPAQQAATEGDQQNAVTATEPRIAELNSLADKAKELAAKQDELQKAVQSEREKNAENPEAQKQALQAQRAPQQQLTQAMRELPRGAAPLARAQAEQAAEEADQSMERNNVEQALQAQADSAAALRQLARQVERQALALAQQTAEELAATHLPPAKANPPVDPNNASPAQPTPELKALADRARQLAAEQRALAEETAQAGDPNAPQLAMNQALSSTESPAPATASEPASTAAPANAATPPGESPAPPGQPQPGTPMPAAPTGEPAAEGTPQPTDSAAHPEPSAIPTAQKPSQSQPEAVAQALKEQQRIALAAKELALNTEAQTGPTSKATEATQKFAKQARESLQKLADGQIDIAAQQGQESSQSGQQAAQEFRQLPPSQGFPSEEKAQSVEQLAERQAQLAERMAQLAQSPAARRMAQQQAQEKLQQETEQLAQELNEVADSFGMQPLQQQNKAEEANASESSAQQAQQSMQAARQNLQQSNPQEAAQQAQQAAKSLREAGKLAQATGQQAQQGQPGEGQPGQQGKNGQQPGQTPSPIPADGALNVAQAAQQLNKIGEQLAKDESMPNPAGEPGQKPGDSKPGEGEGQDGQAEASEGDQQAQNGESKPGESQSGQPPGGQPKASDNLKQTAANLRQAMQQFGLPQGQPGKPGQKNGKPNAQQEAKGSQEGENMSDFGNTDEARIVELENHLKGLSTRNWGELPGTLKTEILQAARKKPDGDYAKLIRKYFDEISKTQRPDLPGATAPAPQGAKP